MTTVENSADSSTNFKKDDDENVDVQFSIDNLSELKLLMNKSMHILCTGYYNGFGIEIRSPEEMSLLYHTRCFGKGSFSRSKPNSHINTGSRILRKRQYQKRISWYKKFIDTTSQTESDKLLIGSNKLTESGRRCADDGNESEADATDEMMDKPVSLPNKHEPVVVVPNSDSEGENYFENFEPKCCSNIVKLKEKLVLTLQEAYFLAYALNCLQILDLDSKVLNLEQCWELFKKVDNNFIPKYVVYHYYRSKGYIVKPGIKFGGDYLLYKDTPEDSHAKYIVLIKLDEKLYNEDWISILGHVRVATTTAKEVILIEVVNNDYITPEIVHDLKAYTVKEVLLSRKIPGTTKEDSD